LTLTTARLLSKLSFSGRSGVGDMCFGRISVRFEGYHYGKWIELKNVRIAENFCIKESITSTFYFLLDGNNIELGNKDVGIGQRVVAPVYIKNSAPIEQEVCVSATEENGSYLSNVDLSFTVKNKTTNIGQGVCFIVPGTESFENNLAVVSVNIVPLSTEYSTANISIKVHFR